MIITPSDFDDRPFKIPNQEESGDLEGFIDDAEIDLAVKHLLGLDLWDEFITAVTSSGVLDQKWLDLRDGATYQYQNVNYKYNGWVDLVRPGIYSLWQPEGTWKYTNVGWVQNKANSAPQAGNQSELLEDQYVFHVKYWNQFVEKVGYQSANCYNYKNSFYGFMKANETTYDGWIFNTPVFKNRFDL